MCNNTNTAFWSGAEKDENYASGSFACNPYTLGNRKKVGVKFLIWSVIVYCIG